MKKLSKGQKNQFFKQKEQNFNFFEYMRLKVDLSENSGI